MVLSTTALSQPSLVAKKHEISSPRICVDFQTIETYVDLLDEIEEKESCEDGFP